MKQLVKKSETFEKEVKKLQNEINTAQLKLDDELTAQIYDMEEQGWTDTLQDRYQEYLLEMNEQAMRRNIIDAKLKQWRQINKQLIPNHALSIATERATKLEKELNKLGLEYDKNSKDIKWQRENHSTKHPDFQAAIEKQLKCVKTHQQKSAQFDKALEQISKLTPEKTSSTGGKKRRRKTKRYLKKKIRSFLILKSSNLV